MSRMDSNLITLDNLSFGYHTERPILTNLNMQIARGKITAIMGSSGCGKTTILRLMSGQIQANCGKICLFDQDLSSLSQRQLFQMRKKIGMLFQFGALFSDMNVAENVAFPLKEHTNLTPRLINKIVAMKLEAVGLTGTQELYPSDLSGGMARRVALARSMALDPELMLYDEPFTGLDPISLSTAAMLIKKLSTSLNQTVVIVTHDIAITMEIADYMYFMDNGQIIAAGTPSQIRANPNPALQQFIQGKVNGPFNFKYSSRHSYAHYLEI